MPLRIRFSLGKRIIGRLETSFIRAFLRMKKSKLRKEAEASLPPECRDAFNMLVDDYGESCQKHFGQWFGNYKSFADLVRMGWRKQP